MPSTAAYRRTLATSILGGLALCLVSIAFLDEGHPVRIAAGIALFVVLPGAALRAALAGPGSTTRLWEQWAMAGALGIATSSLASTVLLAVGVKISVLTVALACSVVTLGATTAALLRSPSPSSATGQRAAWIGVVAVAAVLVGALTGTAIATRPDDGFTTFAFKDPVAAGESLEIAVRGGEASVKLLLESHEQARRQFRVVINAVDRAAPITLEPGQVVETVVSLPKRATVVEFVLHLDGEPYRTLRLNSASDPTVDT